MAEPSLGTSRLAIAGALLAIIAIGGGGFFVGRTTVPEPEPPRPAPETPAPAPAPVPVERPRTLNRADIIALAQQAAAAFVSGAAQPDGVAGSSGRRFDLVLPFGCTGPSEAAGGHGMQWRYDEEGEALRVSVTPMSWQAAEWGLGEHSEGAHARGFWIARPWSTGEGCPSRAGQPIPAGPNPITLPGQTLAIAQFFSGDASRGGSRGERPFEVVRRMAADRFDGTQGLRLRVTGRIGGPGEGGPVRCVQPAGIEQRPICVVMATMEEVRIEDPASNEVLGTWSMRRTG